MELNNFYPRSPCGERRDARLSCFGRIIFLSTLSLRRATASSTVIVILRKNFYPRSPCGERLNGIGLIIHIGGFLSTLSLRRATNGIGLIIHIGGFLSTLSLRRATHWSGVPVVGRSISIHALLAESDTTARILGFNPLISIHALLAESDINKIPNQRKIDQFLSTLSLRRAT